MSGKVLLQCGWRECDNVFEQKHPRQRYCCPYHQSRENYQRHGERVRDGRPRRRKVRLTLATSPSQDLDARTVAGKTERAVIRDLTEHVGGAPTFPQMMLIRRAARLATVIEMMERRLIENNELSDWAGRQYLAWVNSLRRLMVDIGMQKPGQQAPTSLRAYVGGKVA